MKKLIKILSIEDDEFMQIFIKDVFLVHGGHDYEFQTAGTIAETERILVEKKFVPDIIFLDLKLSQDQNSRPLLENGFNLLKEFKSDRAFQKTKIIVFSGFAESEVKARVLELGADKFMLKGEYLPRELVVAVEELAMSKKDGGL